VWTQTNDGAFTSEEHFRKTMTTTTYTTRHIGFAAFLRFVLGNESHVSTKQGGTGYVFVFDDPEYRASELQTAFFSTDGAIAGDAKALLDCSREISHSIIHAKQFGSWERE
jgi:hypothetical protein